MSLRRWFLRSYRLHSSKSFSSHAHSLTRGSLGRFGSPPLICEVLEDRAVPTVYTVTNTNDSGAGSLRQAILDANSNSGVDTINFNIAGGGVQTISLNSGLNSITEGVLIDGYSQPGASANTSATANNATILIQVDGTNAGASTKGFVLTSTGITIQGLSITNFGRIGVNITGASATGNTIVGNFNGVGADGSTKSANNFGIQIDTSSTNNIIGGTVAGAGNIISGNTSHGIVISGNGTSGNVVEGNLIGTNSQGTAGVANGAIGVIVLAGATNNTIGTNEYGQSILSSNGLLSFAAGMAVATDGTIYVANSRQSAFPGLAGGIIRIDPTTGAQTAVSIDGLLQNADDVLVEPDGSLAAMDLVNGIVHVDPTTGAQTLERFSS